MEDNVKRIHSGMPLSKSLLPRLISSSSEEFNLKILSYYSLLLRLFSLKNVQKYLANYYIIISKIKKEDFKATNYGNAR